MSKIMKILNNVFRQYAYMINLNAFVKSMKLTGLRRVILSDSPWQSIVNNKIHFCRNFFHWVEDKLTVLLKM